MQCTFFLPVALTVLAITQNRVQTGMHLAPCPNAAGDGGIRRGPILGRRTRVCRRRRTASARASLPLFAAPET
jgi:hypothetical protein